jgi:thiamine-monophosphate kinase
MYLSACSSDPVREHRRVAALVANFSRSPLQRNRLGESDAELIRIPGTDLLLAITTDAVVEEIETGLYRDPYLIGWMTVVVSASDLAAVGADPLGILLNQTLPTGLESGFEDDMQRGIRDACAACGLPPLGGDINESDRLHVASTAVGTVPAGEAMMRSGVRPGDHLFLTGRAGLGNAFALQVLTREPEVARIPYRPVARLQEGLLLRRFANACMDTSDGMVATLDELMRRSRFGLQLEPTSLRILHPEARNLARRASIPTFAFLAGPHGEFELIFSIPPRRLSDFRAAADAAGISILELGVARQEPGLQLADQEGGAWPDTAGIRNLSPGQAEDLDPYLSHLAALADPAI